MEDGGCRQVALPDTVATRDGYSFAGGKQSQSPSLQFPWLDAQDFSSKEHWIAAKTVEVNAG